MQPQKIKKLYYSISEVSEITSLKKYVLRYWESEFKELKPGKNRAGNRIYTLEEIKVIFLLKKLLYQEKYTIEGAKNKLKVLKSSESQLNLSFEDMRREDALLEIKRQLLDLQEYILNSEDKKNKSSE